MRTLILLVVLPACAGDSASDDDPGPGSCEAVPPDSSGEGTYYDADGTGNCSFDASPGDLMVAAINAADYQSAALCGACLEVTGPNGSVRVRVVDQCPGCAHGDLDLSRQAFQRLSPLSAGRIPITWRQVACDVTGPIAYHLSDLVACVVGSDSERHSDRTKQPRDECVAPLWRKSGNISDAELIDKSRCCRVAVPT